MTINTKFLVIALLICGIKPALAQNNSGGENKQKNNRFFKTATIRYSPFLETAQSTNGGLLRSVDLRNTVIIDANALMNYKLIKGYLSVGGGIQYSNLSRPNFNMLGITGELRGYLSDESSTIYLYIQMGQYFPLGSLFTRGTDVGLGAGFRFRIFQELFMLELSSRNKSVSADNRSFRVSEEKTFITGYYIGLGYKF